MLLGKVSVRLLVIPKGFGFGIEGNIPLQVRTDVPQVANRCRETAEFHIRVGLLAALDTLYEILLVQAVFGMVLG